MSRNNFNYDMFLNLLTLVVDVLANDYDEDGDSLTVDSVTVPGNGTANINADGTITYTPALAYVGTDSFTYTVSDGKGGTDTATVTITVYDDKPVNSDPVVNDDDVAVIQDGSVNIPVLDNDYDPDGDSMTVTDVTKPGNGTVVINADGTITYTPDPGFVGTDTFEYTVSDGKGGTGTGTVTVTVYEPVPINTNPVATDDKVSTKKDISVVVDVLANDYDKDGDPITVESVTVPGNGTAVINIDGTITYTPDLGFVGDDTFTYTISDGKGGTDTATVTITVYVGPVNTNPVAVDDKAITKIDVPVIVGVLANDYDTDGDTLTVTGVTVPGNGAAVINADGTITYTPAPGFVGDDTFIYTISDGKGGTDTATVLVTVYNPSVYPENIPPVANDDSGKTPVDKPVTIDVLANDVDENGDILTITGISNLVNGTVVINSDQTVTFTPDPGFIGYGSFKYTISDGRGGTASADVTIEVYGVTPNADPKANDDFGTTPVNTPVDIYVLSNDYDENGDALTVIGTSIPANGTVKINSNGSITYTPNTGYVGIEQFTYTISDGRGGTDTARVRINVFQPALHNTLPDAVDDVVSINVNQTIKIHVLANDSDADGDPLTVESTTVPGHGSAVINSDGTITYTPNTNYVGNDTFRYTIHDGRSGKATATVMIMIHDSYEPPVVPVNRPPVITGGTGAEGDKNTPIKGTVTATDPDGDPLTFTKTGDPSNGTVVVNPDGSYVYIPKPDFTGTDMFEITVSDGKDGTDTKVITIKVNDIKGIQLHGTVTARKTGETVGGATVKLIDYNNGTVIGTVVTSPDGNYVFNDVDGGLYIVDVTHQKYSDNRRQVHIKHSDAIDGKIREDFELHKFKITLIANPSSIVADGIEETILTATIVDENNKPVAGVLVEFSAEGEMGSFYAGNTAYTDANGTASIPYKSVKVEAVYSITVPVMAKVEDYVREIFAQDQIIITFAPGRIKGIVTDDQNNPIAGSKVVIKHYDENGEVDFLTTCITCNKGYYSVAIPMGNEDYHVEITKSIDISGAKVEKTFIQISKVGSISGKGTEEFHSERTITGIILFVNDNNEKKLLDNVSMAEGEYKLNVTDTNGNPVPGAVATINSEGVFTVTGLDKGTNYELGLTYVFPDGREIIVGKTIVGIKEDGEISINDVLIDPYGTITDSVSKEIIVGAKVVLYYYDTDTEVILPILPGFEPSDNRNPQYSSHTGEYAYMVYPDTDYYIVATKDGYVTYRSPKISVFKEIVKHDFEMVKITSDTGEGKEDAKDGADLAVILESDKIRIATGGTAEFTLTYANKLDEKANDVTVTVLVPDEFEIVEAGDGVIDGNVITWALGDMDKMLMGELKFTVKVKESITDDSKVVTVRSSISSTSDLINTYDDKSDLSVLVFRDGVEMEGIHKRYIKGYVDGLVRPDRPITRGEVAAIFARIMDLEHYDAKPANYTDVPDKYWASAHIRAVTDKGLFTGYLDGSFRPETPITRAELATVIGKYLGIEMKNHATPIKNSFIDTKGSWAEYNIEQVTRFGVIKGYDDHTFRPDQYMIRAEAIAMINRMLHRGPLTNVESSYPDNPETSWFFGDIEEATRTHRYKYDEMGNEIMVEFIVEDLW